MCYQLFNNNNNNNNNNNTDDSNCSCNQNCIKRAAILGLSMEDMELVNSFIEELKDKKDPQEKLNLVSSFSRKSEISYKVNNVEEWAKIQHT